MPVRAGLPSDLQSPIPPVAPDGSPVAEMARVLDRPPPLSHEVLRGDTRLTRRWVHGEVHDTLRQMSGHVVMTFYGAAQEVLWREGADQRSTRTRVGTITVIPEGHEGYWDIAGPLDVSHVYLSDERLRSAAGEMYDGKSVELISRVAIDDPAAARILALLGDEAATGDGASLLFYEQAIDLLCTQLIRGHSSLGSVKPAEPPRGLADWQVKKVTGYMQERLDEAIGLQELADLVNLSRFHFATAFRQATGQSPYGWLTELRISRARQLLGQPELPVTEIALEVGYQTPSAFTAAFRKKTGLTPTEYRRLL